YGSAGCTSPRRVVVLGGSDADADRMRDSVVDRWAAIARREPPMADASECFCTTQVALSHGWRARAAALPDAVASSGTLDLPSAGGRRHLEIVPASLEEAIAALPTNTQTIGHAGVDQATLFQRLVTTPAKRIVPLARMHHMGAVWDGLPLVQSLFEH